MDKAKSVPSSGRRPRVVFVSPLPPAEFGVPVYSARTVEALSRHASVDIVAARMPNIETLRAVNRVLPEDTLCPLDDYDAKFFVHGNHPHHMAAARFAGVTQGGLGIFHDAQQFDFARAFYRHDAALSEIAARHLGKRPDFEDLQRWYLDRRQLPFPYLEPLSGFSQQAVVHSAAQAEAFTKHYPAMKCSVAKVAIQHKLPAEALVPQALQRAKLRCQLHERDINIGTFGFVGHEKLPDIYLFTVRHLHDWGHPVHFWFVGAVPDEQAQAIRTLATQLGLADHVHFSGRVSESAYCDYLLGMDIGLQMRRPYFGQLSGALLDCVAAGLPSISTHALAEAIDAPSIVRRIKNSFSSIDAAEACLEVLQTDLSANRATAEWVDYCEVHSFERYALRLLEIASVS